MKKITSALALIILVIFTLPVCGQVSFQFIPELHGRNVDGLFNCRIINIAGVPQTVSLSVTVTERSKGLLLQVKTASFSLMPCSISLPVSAIRGAGIKFIENASTRLIRQNNFFPEGSYDYCYTLTPSSASGTAVSEQCFTYDLVPFSPLTLVEPYNKDNVCEKRPVLSWQPSVPVLPGSSYQLVLTEVKENQTATAALHYNLPIINQHGIVSTVLPYPAIARELQKGKTYAWQVTAYKGQTVLNRSDVWQFTVSCEDNIAEPLLTDNGYRDIEDLLKGNYYVAEGIIKYAVINPYNEQQLEYGIKCITSPKLKVKRLPKILLKKGKNKISIDLGKNNAFKDGYSYIMSIKLPNGSVKSLRFLYKEAE